MNNTIRIAGAQIPVTPYAQANVMTIRRAIDWAAENNVDYLVTPEVALSGYTSDFDSSHNRIKDALKEIENYAAAKNVGLCLGTLWDEPEADKTVRRNQIRFYSKEGYFLGNINKHFTIEDDARVGAICDERKILIPMFVGEKVIPVGGLICVDMYGVDGHSSIPPILAHLGAKIFIHCTNGIRHIDPPNGLSADLSDEVFSSWHEAHFKRFSFLFKMPIITVDNCYMMDGTEYHGNTSSESGVMINGKWVTKVPRTGTQYFYHDFNLDDIAVEIPTRSSQTICKI